MSDDEYKTAVEALFDVIHRRPGPKLHEYLAHLEWALGKSAKARQHVADIADAFGATEAHTRAALRSERDEMRAVLGQTGEVGHA